ncbi:alpha-mannosidase [Paenibacillus doosanensis]|uniref:alpha-mannosidase n=1 Tax=Paenibacillus doosanensis TaxID=1229154 RepID=UPI002180002F|nr:alpha-mannosidase [Paenibacillus doosanensis]MCS7463670.1 alpha-mannosidase [Paenibacillus doosanensis]
MWFTYEKTAARVKELAEFRYRDRQPVSVFESLEDPEGAVGARPALPLSAHPDASVMRLGDRWAGQDRYLWLAAEVRVPFEWEGRMIVGRFDFGRTGGGNNSGFESLLYVNGHPYQGVDSNHREVFFEGCQAGSTLQLCFRLWSGLGGYRPNTDQEHRLERAELCWLDEAADDLYYSARAALETVRELHEHAPERALLLSAVDQALLLVDWSHPGSEPFYASVAAAAERLNEALAALPKQHPVTVRCIGHTHIDVAWLWRLKHTREKAARSFSTVLRLMEKYPDYIFLQTMPQLYEYIKNDYPDIYDQIKERVREGRWEAGGGMWLEADCNLTSGESLVRQLLYGTRFLKEEFGVDCKYLWLPDVFGYSWALPQILRKSGIDTFMTTKISWNQYNRMPHDTFRWRGIDGTEVLTHFITTPDDAGGWLYTYNGEVTARSVAGIWETYRDKAVNRELLLSYGYGDGGGGVTRDMLELRRRLSTLPGIPHVTTGRADEYFERLHWTVAETKEYVHTWDGELYLELHRGTYTSQAYNKKMNRKLELLAREAEWMGVLGGLQSGDWSRYAHEALTAAWKIVLRNQFHDIIPGSSIHEVYEDSRIEYEEAERLLRQAAREAEAALAAVNTPPDGAAASSPLHQGSEEGALRAAEPTVFTVWNSAGWTRGGIAHIASEQPECAAAAEQGEWTDAQGRSLASQKISSGWLVQIGEAPSLGYAGLHFKPSAAAPASGTDASPFVVHDGGMDTPFYRLKWNEAGQLVSIWDLSAGREVLADEARGNVLQVFEDKPKGRHEAWDIDIFYTEKMEEIRELRSVELVELGAVRASVRFVWSYGASTVEQELTVYAHSRRIDFRTVIDWQERRKLLKAAFPVRVRSTEATYDIQFGNVKRPTHWNTSWDFARFEVVGHQWADLSERGYGVSLLNDCKYGYDIKDNVIRLTLLKSAMVPDPQADQGRHEFTYSLLPHQGDWLDGETVQEAWDLNAPLIGRKGAVQAPGSLLRIEGGYVHVDAVKKAEDDERVVIRFHEFGGQRGRIALTSDYTIRSWQECDLLERPAGDKREAEDGAIRLELKPYEIKTLLLELSR